MIILDGGRCGSGFVKRAPHIAGKGIERLCLKNEKGSIPMDPDSAQQAVTALAQGWADAELRGDVPFLKQTLTDDFVGVGMLGFLLDKQQWLARHRSGEMRNSVYTLDETQARVYNTSAIVVGRLTQEATYQSHPTSAQLRTMLICVRQDGQCHLAGLQVTPIGQPPSFARP